MAFNFICPKCGATVSAPDTAAGQSGNCVFCHADIVAPPLPGMAAQPTTPSAQPVVLANADLGRRGVAWAIDYALLCAVILPVNLVLGFTHTETTIGPQGNSRVWLPTGAPGWLVGGAITLVYGALMESSGWQATIGKRILGIQVVDTACRRLTRPKAFARNLVKGVTAPVFCCAWMYLVAVFSPRNQALHDMAADSLVLNRE